MAPRRASAPWLAGQELTGAGLTRASGVGSTWLSRLWGGLSRFPFGDAASIQSGNKICKSKASARALGSPAGPRGLSRLPFPHAPAVPSWWMGNGLCPAPGCWVLLQSLFRPQCAAGGHSGMFLHHSSDMREDSTACPAPDLSRLALLSAGRLWPPPF